ncbi:Tyrosinase central domain-containing protein [Mycena venus]|uniref:Tyrosinase central domain-containing protein n=1 Tax=Mycena venus TaxID=2733690 RepID=A0A8H6YVW9_9AGAR|nr:Tyrosinase central domain-containing protein [Mycena venus]
MHDFTRTLLRRARRVFHRVLRGKRTARAPLSESSLPVDKHKRFLITTSPVIPSLADIGDPVFPLELEQAIFETTAMTHPSTIPALLRVARRVGIWIEPLLYRVVRVNRRDHVDDMLRALVDGNKSKPADVLCTYVRHLALESLHHCSFYEGRSLLQRCTNVIDFGSNLWFTDPSLLPILAEMHLQRLSVNLKALFGYLPIDLNHPLFRSVTHLDMFRIEGVAEILVELPTLPALTHLALDSDLSRDIVLSVLPDCPRLKLLLVQWQLFEKRDYMAARTPHVYDVRFVIGLYGDYWADWEAGAREGVDAWSRGDEFIARKREGLIEGTCYWLT